MLARVVQPLCCTCNCAVNCYSNYKGNGASGKVEHGEFRTYSTATTFAKNVVRRQSFLSLKLHSILRFVDTGGESPNWVCLFLQLWLDHCFYAAAWKRKLRPLSSPSRASASSSVKQGDKEKLFRPFPRCPKLWQTFAACQGCLFFYSAGKPLLSVLPTHLLLQNVNEKLAFELNKAN